MADNTHCCNFSSSMLRYFPHASQPCWSLVVEFVWHKACRDIVGNVISEGHSYADMHEAPRDILNIINHHIFNFGIIIFLLLVTMGGLGLPVVTFRHKTKSHPRDSVYHVPMQCSMTKTLAKMIISSILCIQSVI